jgi:DNA modification methylase
MTDIIWTNVRVRLGDLKPWVENPRTSSKAQAKRILASFEQFGQVAPIAISPTNEVLDGHQRLSALLTVHGASYEVEARRSSRPLTDDERRALVLALANATGSWNWDSLSGWNTETLTEWGFDKDTLKGWKADVAALGEFIKSEAPPVTDAEVDTDRAAELLEKWGVKLGDLWQIGEHRLICGDCTDAATVARVMGGDCADLGIHDAPYNVNMQRSGSIEGDKQTPEEFRVFCNDWLSNFYSVSKDANIFVCIGFREYPLIAELCRPLWDEKNCIVWSKPTIGMGGLNGGYRYQHELIWFGGKGISDKSLCDVWGFDRDADPMHPTLKPTPLIEKMVKDTDGQIVADFFCGSGTTIVACENLGRKCRAIEISPAYVAVALERMSQAFPGIDIHRIDAGG